MADVETEREMSRAEVAAYLREFAEKLDAGATNRGESPNEDDAGSSTDETESAIRTASETTERDEGTGRDEGTTRRSEEGRVTFTLGNESATVNPPETIQFEVAVDSTAGMLESGARETVGFTLQWDAEPTDDDGELGLH